MAAKRGETGMKPKRSKLARPYRVLNLNPGGYAAAVMFNEASRWCLSKQEARDLAEYAKARGYRVEIVYTIAATDPA